MKEKDGKEDYDVVGGILSPTLTVEEKTDEEVYKEAFDHFDGNHSKTIPTSVSWKNCLKSIFINIQSLIYGLRRVGLNPTEEEIRDMINQVTTLVSSCLSFFVSSCLHIIMSSCLHVVIFSCLHAIFFHLYRPVQKDDHGQVFTRIETEAQKCIYLSGFHWWIVKLQIWCRYHCQHTDMMQICVS